MLNRWPRTDGIWISLAQRSLTLQLRKNPAFGHLDLLGIPWNLSSESCLFNGLRATSGEFFSRGALSLRKSLRSRKKPLKPLALNRPSHKPILVIFLLMRKEMLRTSKKLEESAETRARGGVGSKPSCAGDGPIPEDGPPGAVAPDAEGP